MFDVICVTVRDAAALLDAATSYNLSVERQTSIDATNIVPEAITTVTQTVNCELTGFVVELDDNGWRNAAGLARTEVETRFQGQLTGETEYVLDQQSAYSILSQLRIYDNSLQVTNTVESIEGDAQVPNNDWESVC